MSFFSVLKLLFPSGKAFDLTQETTVKKLVRGLSHVADDVKAGNDLVYLDLFPDSTRALEEWENQFSVLFADEQYGDTRRGILKSLWQANSGGQDVKYLEGLLKNVSEDIMVVENSPVKNPRDANSVFGCMCGQGSSVCGNASLSCGYKKGDSEFVPSVIRNDTEGPYDVPVGEEFWENYFFVCKKVVKNNRQEIVYCQKLQLDAKWQKFIEYLILKVKPVQTGAVVFIEYVENLDESRMRGRKNG